MSSPASAFFSSTAASFVALLLLLLLLLLPPTVSFERVEDTTVLPAGINADADDDAG